MARNDHDQFGVSDEDVARVDRHAAAADRHVQVGDMELRQPGGGALTSCVERDPDPAQIGSVSKGAVGDRGDASPARQARHEHQTA